MHARPDGARRGSIKAVQLLAVLLLLGTAVFSAIVLIPTARANPAIRINAGGAAQNVNGVEWLGCGSADACNGFVSGGFAYTQQPLPPIMGVPTEANEPIYQTEWTGGETNGVPQGALAYAFNVPVANGEYLIRLHFAELNKPGIGLRVFDVNLEGGDPEIVGLDIFAQTGALYTVMVREFPVTIGDGAVTIEFIRQIENAKISAIEIVPVAPPPATETAVPPPTDLPTAPPEVPVGTPQKGGEVVVPPVVAPPVEPTAVPTPEGDVNQPAPAAIRINAGGAAQNVNGVEWLGCGSADACNGFVSGGFAYSEPDAISGVQPPANEALYQSEWTGGCCGPNPVPVGAIAFAFNVPVANGSYLVRLHFAELNKFAPGTRVFDVNIEGGPIELPQFDVFAAAGGAQQVVVREFPVAIGDDVVTIEFTRQIENAKISAIEIVPSNASAPPATAVPPTAVPVETPVVATVVPTATSVPAPPTPIPAAKSALLVVGNTSLTAADAAIKARLEQLGYTVSAVDDGKSTSADANGKAIVLISSTSQAVQVNTKFRDVAVPVLSWEPYLFDDLGMTGSAEKSDYDFAYGQSRLAITDPSHPMAAGLMGTITTNSASTEYTWGRPSASAARIAALPNDPNRAVIFGYEANSAMIGHIAAARRIGFFFGNTSATSLNESGWTLFTAAVNWATGTQWTPPPPPATPTTISLTATSIPPTATAIAPTPTASTSFTWQSKAAAPQGVYEAQGAAVNGKLYVLGGFYNSSIQATTRSDVYDLATNTWKRIADMPEKITHGGQAVDGSIIYIAGGFIGDHPGPSTNHVWKYNTANNTWSAGPSLPAARGGGALVRLGRNLHYFGGVTRDSNGAYIADSGDHWVLNLDGGTRWAAAAPMPNPRNHLGGAVVDGKIYAVGGQRLGDEQQGNQNAVHRYDPATNTWANVASMPRPLGHITGNTFVRNGRVVVAAGVTQGSTEVANVIEYNPQTNMWVELPKLPAPRQSPVADVINGRIIVTTGSSGGPQTQTWMSSQ